MDEQVQRLVNAIGAVFSDLEDTLPCDLAECVDTTELDAALAAVQQTEEERQRAIAHERLARQVLFSWSSEGDHAGNLAKVQGGYILSTWRKGTRLHEGNNDAFIPNEMIPRVIHALQRTNAAGAT